MNAIAKSRKITQQLQASIPTHDVAAELASFEHELAYIRETVGFIDSVMLRLECQESEMGELDGCFVNLYKLSPRNMTPVYLIYVNNNRFETITDAVRFIASRLQF